MEFIGQPGWKQAKLNKRIKQGSERILILELDCWWAACLIDCCGLWAAAPLARHHSIHSTLLTSFRLSCSFSFNTKRRQPFSYQSIMKLRWPTRREQARATGKAKAKKPEWNLMELNGMKCWCCKRGPRPITSNLSSSKPAKTIKLTFYNRPRTAKADASIQSIHQIKRNLIDDWWMACLWGRMGWIVCEERRAVMPAAGSPTNHSSFFSIID